MKKRCRFLSLILALTVLISAFGGTFAYAAETEKSTLTFTNLLNLNDMDSLKTMRVGQMPVYGVTVSNPNATLTATSTDSSVLQVDLFQVEGGDYMFSLTALKAGSVDITFTSSDGASATFWIIVENGGPPNFSVTADTTLNFSIVRGNSYFMEVHFTSEDYFSFPMLEPLDGSVLQTYLIDTDGEGNFLYRVDAVGDTGKNTDLLIGAYGYVPRTLCNVKITANKNLRVDTIGEYAFNIGDTYRFIAYTNSATAPTVNTNNDLATAKYLGKVAGGYEYQVKALKAGESLVRVTLNGETASVPLYIYDGAVKPYVESDTTSGITLKPSTSYTYKISVMGGGEPKFVGGTGGVISTQIVKKDGIDYYCKVTAIGSPKAETSLYISFPQSGHPEYNQNLGNIKIAAPDPVVMKSDTTSDFSLKKGASYTFKISGATSFNPGTNGIFKTEQVSKSGNDTFYKITAIGNPGQGAGFYISVPGQPAQKVCTVTVAVPDPVVMKSDTTSDFSVKKGASYTFKISGATSFNPGTNGVFKTEMMSKSGNDTYYRITAIGNPGQQTGFYMSVADQPTQKVCIVAVS